MGFIPENYDKFPDRVRLYHESCPIYGKMFINRQLANEALNDGWVTSPSDLKKAVEAVEVVDVGVEPVGFRVG